MKLTLATLSTSLMVLSLMSVAGVGQRKSPKGTSKPVTTQTATTEDGRTVVLRSNKTWDYAAGPKGADQPAAEKGKVANSTLSIETGLVFKSGDVKPLARTEFHLLDASLIEILKTAGIDPPRMMGSAGEGDRDYISGFAFATKYPGSDSYKDFYPKALTALKPHILKTVTTDFTGKAKFEPVSAGTYYVLGVGMTPRGFVIWNLKVELTPGEVPVVLDQNNAEIAL